MMYGPGRRVSALTRQDRLASGCLCAIAVVDVSCELALLEAVQSPSEAGGRWECCSHHKCSSAGRQLCLQYAAYFVVWQSK